MNRTTLYKAFKIFIIIGASFAALAIVVIAARIVSVSPIIAIAFALAAIFFLIWVVLFGKNIV